MKKTEAERQRARLRKIIDEMDKSKQDNMLTILKYMANLSPEEKKDLYAISKSKGFNANLFAQRLRETGEVTI